MSVPVVLSLLTEAEYHRPLALRKRRAENELMRLTLEREIRRELLVQQLVELFEDAYAGMTEEQKKKTDAALDERIAELERKHAN